MSDLEQVTAIAGGFDLQTMRRFVQGLRKMQCLIRDSVLMECALQENREVSATAEPGAGDYIYPIDRVSEKELLAFVEQELATIEPMVVIGEGIPDGKVVLPRGVAEEKAAWRMIVDPIDGTRGLMYQKRPAWILTGIAPNLGPKTSLNDIVVAVQTEIPLLKQHKCDQLWAIRGQGAQGERWDHITKNSQDLLPRPSSAKKLLHGYATTCRFFPGGRDILATIDDKLASRLLGSNERGASVFEDQYACTGGQLAGLVLGQDRFVADLRPLLAQILSVRGEPMCHCCHPYDICTALIAEESGVAIRNLAGQPLDATLDTSSNVTWIGYANKDLHRKIEPVLREVCQELGLLEGNSHAP